MAKNDGKFKKGELPPVGKPISAEVAREYQAKSAEARKANRTLRETMLAALSEDGGGGVTRMEHLVRKAMENHRKGKLTFHDLKDLAAVLGEGTLNVKTEGPAIVPMTPEAIEALSKWSSKEE